LAAGFLSKRSLITLPLVLAEAGTQNMAYVCLEQPGFPLARE
jgi:hypothetical protein